MLGSSARERASVSHSDICPKLGRTFPASGLLDRSCCFSRSPKYPKQMAYIRLRVEASLPFPIETVSMATTPTRILIADDQPDVLSALRLLLKGQGYETEAVSSPAELLGALSAREFDLLLMDLNYARDTTSGREGLDLLSHLKELEDTPAIVVMTGWATVGLAVEAMQYGVADFVEKPWTNSRLLEILQKQVASGAIAAPPAAARRRKTATTWNWLTSSISRNRK